MIFALKVFNFQHAKLVTVEMIKNIQKTKLSNNVWLNFELLYVTSQMNFILETKQQNDKFSSSNFILW